MVARARKLASINNAQIPASLSQPSTNHSQTTTLSRSFGRLRSSNCFCYSLRSNHGILMTILSFVKDVKPVALRVITAAPPFASNAESLHSYYAWQYPCPRHRTILGIWQARECRLAMSPMLPIHLSVL